MSRIIQNPDSHGSLKDLQILINNKKSLLNSKLSGLLQKNLIIDWMSPIKFDNYAEYRDGDFLKVLGIYDLITEPLNSFWPKSGPQWDGLGVCNKDVFLIEAKANIPEMISPATGASPKSKIKIIDSINATKKYLGVNNKIDWIGTFYQYANRLAHLYYLRVLNKQNAHLVFIYFINDSSVDGPKSIAEWHGAIKTMEGYLGVPKNHKLKKYIHDVFIDVNDLK